MMTVKSRVQRRPKFTYSGPTLAHRQYLAFRQRELTPHGLLAGQVFRRQRGEIGIGPKPAAGCARRPLGAQKPVGAGFIAHPRRHPGAALFQQSLLNGLLSITRKSKCNYAPVTITLGRAETFEPQRVSCGQRLQRRTTVVGGLDSREPHFAAVAEQ